MTMLNMLQPLAPLIMRATGLFGYQQVSCTLNYKVMCVLCIKILVSVTKKIFEFSDQHVLWYMQNSLNKNITF